MQQVDHAEAPGGGGGDNLLCAATIGVLGFRDAQRTDTQKAPLHHHGTMIS